MTPLRAAELAGAAVVASPPVRKAKEQRLAAETEDAFDRAERRVRLPCGS